MRINSAFKALADPTRRKILQLLREHGELSAGELAEEFDLAWASVSHHFKMLKDAGLVACRREGQHLYYSLNTTVMEDVLAVIWDLFASPEDGKGKKS